MKTMNKTQTTSFQFGQRSRRRAEGVHPLLWQCALQALSVSKHDMLVPWRGGLRTAAEQRELFKQGASTLDGYDRKSYHQSGHALDLAPVEGGYANTAAFRHFAACMFNCYQEIIQKKDVDLLLEWGGHWQRFIDRPHWQLVTPPAR